MNSLCYGSVRDKAEGNDKDWEQKPMLWLGIASRVVSLRTLAAKSFSQTLGPMDDEYIQKLQNVIIPSE